MPKQSPKKYVFLNGSVHLSTAGIPSPHLTLFLFHRPQDRELDSREIADAFFGPFGAQAYPICANVLVQGVAAPPANADAQNNPAKYYFRALKEQGWPAPRRVLKSQFRNYSTSDLCRLVSARDAEVPSAELSAIYFYHVEKLLPAPPRLSPAQYLALGERVESVEQRLAYLRLALTCDQATPEHCKNVFDLARMYIDHAGALNKASDGNEFFFKQGLGALRFGIELMASYLRSNPAPGVWLELGLALEKASRFDEAVEAYLRAVDSAGDNTEAVDAYHKLSFLYSMRSIGRLGERGAITTEELLEAEVKTPEDHETAVSYAFDAVRRLQKTKPRRSMSEDYVQRLRSVQDTSLMLLSRSHKLQESTGGRSFLQSDGLSMEKVRLFGWLSSEEAQTYA